MALMYSKLRRDFLDYKAKKNLKKQKVDTIIKRSRNVALATLLVAVQVASPLSSLFQFGNSGRVFAADTGFKTPTATHAPNDFDVNTVANVQTSDNVYVTDNDGSEQGYSNFDFPVIPAGSIIDGIEVTVEANSTDSGSDCQVRTSLSWNNGTNYTSAIDATIDDTEGTDTLGGATNTWGRTWAAGDFTNANFVLKIQDRDPGGDCTDSATTSVDQLQTKVYYTDPATLPDLTITKTNDVSGNVTVNNPFNWTLTVTNTGGGPATFNDQDIIEDDLPNSNVNYAVTSNLVVSTAGGVTGSIDCDISSSTLDCDDNSGGSGVVIPSGGSFSVTVGVTPTDTGNYSNPRSGGGNICRVDPDTLITESNEANNNCSDSVTSNIDTGTANPQLPQACGLDIALVLDNSTSIDAGELAQMKLAMAAFTTALNGTPTQFSVTKFATTATMVQAFTSNVTDVNTAINNIPVGGGFTNWQDGLTKAQGTLPNRPDVDFPNLVIFASDGNPNRTGPAGTDVSESQAVADAKLVSDAIKTSGTRMLALGIGSDLDTANLQIISGPLVDTGDVLTSDVITSDFANLAADLAEFASQTCGGTITTTKLIDADGNANTTNDRTPAQNWTFDVNGAPSNPAPVQTDANGQTPAVNVDPGTYSVNETQQNGYGLLSASCTGASNNGSPSGTSVTGVIVGANDIVVCTFINYPTKGSVKVDKKVDADGNGTFEGGNTEANNLGFDWAIDAETVDNDMGTTQSNIPTGNHTVTEDTVTGYHFVGWYQTGNTSGNTCANPQGTTLPINITVVEGQTTNITLCNARDVGNVSFVKQVLGGGPAIETDWTFHIFLSNTEVGTAQHGDSKSLVTESYNVTETGTYSSLYSLTGAGGVCSLLNNVITMLITTSGGECSITNTRKTGTLKVVKDVVNDNGGNKTSDDFTFQVNGDSAQSFDPTTEGDGEKILTGVPTGTYSVTEPEANTMGYATTYSNCTNVEVVEGQTTTCTITNDDIQPKLTLVKAIDGNQYGDTASSDDFGLTIGGVAANSGQAYGKSVGSYAINEAGLNGYGFVNITGTNCPAVLGGNVTLALGDDITCTIHNAAVQPKLVVTKLVTNDNSGTKDDNDFTMTVSGNSQVVPNFPGNENGTEILLNEGNYSVDELANADYIKSVGANCSGTIALGETKYCTITNNDVPHPSISVEKSGPATAYEGDQIVYHFVVTNTGDTVLNNVGISDDIAGDEACDTTTLAPQASTNCTATFTIPTPQVANVTNTVTASGTDPDETTVTGTDDHTLDVLHPAIVVEKDGPASAVAGSTVTYTFAVTNTGDVPISGLTVIDNIAGQAVLKDGDEEMDNVLNVGETWTYTAQYTIPAGQTQPVVNTATACGYEYFVQNEEILSLQSVVIGDNQQQICDDDTHTTNIPKVLAATTTTAKPAVLADTGSAVGLLQIFVPAILSLVTFGAYKLTRNKNTA